MRPLEQTRQPRYLTAWLRRDLDVVASFCFNMGVMRCGVEVEASVRPEELGRIVVSPASMGWEN